MNRASQIIIVLVFVFMSVAGRSFEKAKLLDLKYKKIKPNQTSASQKVTISVSQSASPLFYQLNSKVSSIQVSGHIDILKPITRGADDVYFSLGLVYEGSYRPGFIAKKLMPHWLKTISSLDSTKGLGEIVFHEASAAGVTTLKEKKFHGIKIINKTNTHISNNEFKISISNIKRPVLALWLRAEGDDSGAQFKVTLSDLIINR